MKRVIDNFKIKVNTSAFTYISQLNFHILQKLFFEFFICIEKFSSIEIRIEMRDLVTYTLLSSIFSWFTLYFSSLILYVM